MNRKGNYISIILVFIFWILIVSGCSNEVEQVEAKLINIDDTSIDTIKIQSVDENGIGEIYPEIKDETIIKAVLAILSNVEFKKISSEEENKILSNGKKLIESNSYIIDLVEKNQTVGLLIVLSKDGKIIFYDVSMILDGERPEGYLAQVDEEKTEEIIHYLINKK